MCSLEKNSLVSAINAVSPMLSSVLLAAVAFAPHHNLHAARAHGQARRAVQPSCVATSNEDKAVLAAAKKVMRSAAKFGVTQGKVAQLWVEEAMRGGNPNPAALTEVELVLFEECKLEDGGKCAELSTGMEELLSAVEEKRAKPSAAGFFEFKLGATPIENAAAKVRAAATSFGPEQKEAADAWIKKVAGGQQLAASSLLEEQILLFGECVLSEGSTQSNCEELEQALEEMQAALDSTNIASASVGKIMSTKPSAAVDASVEA